MIKKIIFTLIALVCASWANVIEWQDDDRTQILTFEDCDTTYVQYVILGWGINPDSGWTEEAHSLRDTVELETKFVWQPDRDSSGYIVPGYYSGEYWWYLHNVVIGGDTILAVDTNHVTWEYTIPMPCAGSFHLD